MNHPKSWHHKCFRVPQRETDLEDCYFSSLYQMKFVSANMLSTSLGWLPLTILVSSFGFVTRVCKNILQTHLLIYCCFAISHSHHTICQYHMVLIVDPWVMMVRWKCGCVYTCNYSIGWYIIYQWSWSTSEVLMMCFTWEVHDFLTSSHHRSAKMSMFGIQKQKMCEWNVHWKG